MHTELCKRQNIDGHCTTCACLLQSKLFVEGGVNKIRLTGGEPTLRRDIIDLTRELNALPGLEAIGITTNGIALRRKLPDLRAHGEYLHMPFEHWTCFLCCQSVFTISVTEF